MFKIGTGLWKATVKAIAASLICALIVQVIPHAGNRAFAASYTYTVTNTADSGAGSLREAVNNARSGQSIGFGFAAGTELLIELESPLSVAEGVTVDASGAPGLVLSVKSAGYDHVRSESGTITLRGLTFTGLGIETIGAGGIYAGDSLIMEGCRVLNTYGGGVYAANSMTLSGCEFMGNIGEGSEGVYQNNVRIGIIATDNLTMTDTTVRGNGGHDKHVIVARSSLNMTKCIIDGNVTTRHGGGVYAGGGRVENSEITYNTTGLEGGGIFFFGAGEIINSKIVGNASATNGGGVYANGALTVSGSEIRGNGGDKGGGLYTWEKAAMTNSTVTSNYAAGLGGGAYLVNGGNIEGSTFSNNRTELSGGGLFCETQTYENLSITNCTFAYNRAMRDGGGVGARQASITCSTFTGNLAGTPECAGSYYEGFGAGVYIDGGIIAGSIISGNYNSSICYHETTDDEGNAIHIPANHYGSDLYAGQRYEGTYAYQYEGAVRLTDFSTPTSYITKSIIAGRPQNFMDCSAIGTVNFSNVPGGALRTLYAGRLADNGGPTKTVALYSAVEKNIPFQYERRVAGYTQADQRGNTRSGGLDNPGAFYYAHPYRVTLEGDPPIDNMPVYKDNQMTSEITHVSLRSALYDAIAAEDSAVVIDMSIDHTVIQETIAEKEAREALQRRNLAIMIVIVSVVVIVAVVITVATAGAGSALAPALFPMSSTTAAVFETAVATAAAGVTAKAAIAAATATSITYAVATFAAGAAVFLGAAAALGVGVSMMNETDPAAQEPVAYSCQDSDGKRRSMIESSLSLRNYGAKPVRELLDEEKYQTITFPVNGAVLDSPLSWDYQKKIDSLTIKGKTNPADMSAATLITNRGGGRVIETDRAMTIVLENLILTGANNTRTDGALIYAPNAHVIMRNCYVYNNSAMNGVVYAGGVTAENCVFENNYADGFSTNVKGGGAIYAGGAVRLTNSSFINNSTNQSTSARMKGGAIYAQSVDAVNTIFRGNSAYEGNAIYAETINMKTAELSGNGSGYYTLSGDNIFLTNVTMADGSSNSIAVSAEESAALISSTVTGFSIGVAAPKLTLCASIVAGNRKSDIMAKELSNNMSICNIAQEDLASVMDTKRVTVFGSTYLAGRINDNGGFGRTVAINPLGLAGNAVVPEAARALGMPANDGRGMPRSAGGEKFDIGAFESRVFYADPNTDSNFLVNASLSSQNSPYKGNTIVIKDVPEGYTHTKSLNINHNVTIIAGTNPAGGPGLTLKGGLRTSNDMFSHSTYADIVRVANISFEYSEGGVTSAIVEDVASGYGRVEAYNCSFTGYPQGAVQARSLHLVNCLFKNNSSASNAVGGAVTLKNVTAANSSGKIINCTFHGNSAPKGSAILRVEGLSVPLSLVGNTFTGNVGDGAISGVSPGNTADFRYNIIFANFDASGTDRAFNSAVNPAALGISGNNFITGINGASGTAGDVFTAAQTDVNGNDVGALHDMGGGRSAVFPNAANTAVCAAFNTSLHMDLPATDCLGTPRFSDIGSTFYFGAAQVEPGGEETAIDSITLTSAKTAYSQTLQSSEAVESAGMPIYSFDIMDYTADDLQLTVAAHTPDSGLQYEYYKKDGNTFRYVGQGQDTVFALDEGENFIRLRVRRGAQYSEYGIRVVRHGEVIANNNEIVTEYIEENKAIALSGQVFSLRNSAHAAIEGTNNLGGTITLEGEGANAFRFRSTGSGTCSVGNDGIINGLTVEAADSFTSGSGTLSIRFKPHNSNSEGAVYTIAYEKSVFARYITISEIPDVSIPSAGLVAGDSLETEQYTATVEYKDKNNEVLNGPFVLEAEYTAFITITPKGNYTLIGLPDGFFSIAGMIGSAQYQQGSNTAAVQFPPTPAFTPIRDTHYEVSGLNDAGWSGDKIEVSAKAGYQVSLSDDGGWQDKLTWSDETDNGFAAFYVKNTVTGEFSRSAVEQYKIDKTAPGAAANYGRGVYFDFKNGSGKRFTSSDQVILLGTDNYTVLPKIDYYMSETSAIGADFNPAADLNEGDWTSLKFALNGANWGSVQFGGNGLYTLFARVTDEAGNVGFSREDIMAFDNSFLMWPLPETAFPLDLGEDFECQVSFAGNTVKEMAYNGEIVSTDDYEIGTHGQTGADTIVFKHDYLSSLEPGRHEFIVSYYPMGQIPESGRDEEVDAIETTAIIFSTADTGVKMWYDADSGELPPPQDITLDLGTVDAGYVKAPSKPFTITNTTPLGIGLFGLDAVFEQDSKFIWSIPEGDSEGLIRLSFDSGYENNVTVRVEPKPGLAQGEYEETAIFAAYTQPWVWGGDNEDEYKLEVRVTVRLKVADAAPVITAEALPNGTYKTVYSQAVIATGNKPMTWSLISGSLPNGLTLNAATGEISGAPEAAGVFSATVRAANDLGYDEKEIFISIDSAPPIIATASLQGGTQGQEYSRTLAAESGEVTHWVLVEGALPPGLMLDMASGEISGTPSTGGTFEFTVMALNSAGSSTKNLSIDITSALIVPEISAVTLGADSVTVDLVRPQEGSPLLIVAVYNSGRELLAIKKQNIAQSGLNTVTGISLPETEDIIVKAMMLKGAGSIIPLCPAMETKRNAS